MMFDMKEFGLDGLKTLASQKPVSVSSIGFQYVKSILDFTATRE